MAGSDKTVKVSLVADTDRYSKGMAVAANETDRLGKRIDQADSKSKGFATSAGKATAALKGMAVAGAAVAGTAVVAFLQDAVAEASDLQQTVAKSNIIFGDNAAKIEAWGETAAEKMGLSKAAALEAAASFGDMFSQIGIAGDQAATMSQDVVQLAADLGSFNNLPTADVIDRISASFRGEFDSLQAVIPNINAARVQTEAMAATGKTNAASLTAQEKAMATLAIIQKDGARAQGDFARSSGTLAVEQQKLAASWKDAQAQLGEFLLPILTKVMEALRGGVDMVVAAVHAWEQVPGPIKAAVAALIAWRIAQGTVAKGAGLALDALKSLREAFSYAAASASRAGGGFAGLGAGFRTFTGSAGMAKAAMGGMKSAGSALMGLAGGPWGLAITGLTVAITGYFQAQENARKAAEEFADTLDKTTGKFTEQSRELAQNKFFKDFAQEDYSKVAGSLEKAGVGVGNLIAAYEKGGPAVDEFKAKFDEWRSSQEAMDLARQGVNIEALGNSYAALGRDVDRARQIAEVNAQAQKNTADATKAGGDAAAQAKPPVDRYAETLKKIKDEAEKGKERHKELAAAMLEVKAAAGDADAAAIAYQQSLDDATASVKENGRTLDINTEKGRANSSALLSLKSAALASAEANLKNGEDITVVKGQMDSARESFIKVAMQMNGGNRKAAEALATKYGLTRDSVDQLKGSMDKIPKQVASKISVEDEQAKRRVRELQTLLTGDWLNDKTVRITTIYSEVGSTAARMAGQSRDSRRNRAISGYRDGGYTGDFGINEVAGVVHGKEYVINADSTAKIMRDAPGLLDRLNGYEGGGYVTTGAPIVAGGHGIDYARLGREVAAAMSTSPLSASLQASLVVDGRQAGRIVAAGTRANRS